MSLWDMDIYTYVHSPGPSRTMAHKTLTVSEEAYNALARLKFKDESFTKVILRLAQQKSKGSFLTYMKSISPDPGLADSLERVLEKRRYTRIGNRGE